MCEFVNSINTPANKNKIAIVVVGYNRLAGLKRVLSSLNNAFYSSNDIPLVISIDCSGNEELYEFVHQYSWLHGDKYVNIQTSRLGLRDHIYQCGDLTQYFKAIALFEDDLWVSPFYYNYLETAVSRYGDDNRLCEISLYRNERMGRSGFYFDVLHNGSDCFLWQDVSTWGQCWTRQMWSGFRAWIDTHEEEYINQVDIPDYVKKWTRAWSRYYIAYAVDTHKYILFPYESLTTNFNDAGGEHGGGDNVVQVNTLHGERQYRYTSIENMVHYDIYANNEQIEGWLPIEFSGSICIDLYGNRSNYQNKRYILTMKRLPYKKIAEWGLSYRPVELNLKYGIQGHGICLYDTLTPTKVRINRFNSYPKECISYFLRGFNVFYLAGFLFSELFKELKIKIGLEK